MLGESQSKEYVEQCYLYFGKDQDMTVDRMLNGVNLPKPEDAFELDV